MGIVWEVKVTQEFFLPLMPSMSWLVLDIFVFLYYAFIDIRQKLGVLKYDAY
jgi:hypothetical protein